MTLEVPLPAGRRVLRGFSLLFQADRGKVLIQREDGVHWAFETRFYLQTERGVEVWVSRVTDRALDMATDPAAFRAESDDYILAGAEEAARQRQAGEAVTFPGIPLRIADSLAKAVKEPPPQKTQEELDIEEATAEVERFLAARGYPEEGDKHAAQP